MKSSILLLAFFCLLGLSKAAAGANMVPPDGKTAPASGVLPTDATDGKCVLCPRDEIKLGIAGEPNLSGNYRILMTGEVSLPLVGSVKIAGLSVTAAAAKIRDLYAKYVQNPKVTLTIRAYAEDIVTALGAVKRPGQIPIPKAGKLDLATAIAACGGVTEKADLTRILVVRASGATETFDMASIKSGAAGRVELEAGDHIVVNQSKVQTQNPKSAVRAE